MTRRSATPTKYLIRDRDSRFTSALDSVFKAEGIQVLCSLVQVPRANAICERMIGTIRRALLDRILILHEEHARRALTRWLQHYSHSRPHRSLGQLTPDQTEHEPPRPINLAEHRLRRHAILGGITHEYWTATAV
ncbi:MAG TPA: integrase core domain-containing protein [Actinocrinis sp.]|nr:integrase core domain-containing protein [Actinocrinis sp.]